MTNDTSTVVARTAKTAPDYKAAMLYHSDRADEYAAQRDALAAKLDILVAALQQIQREFGATPNGHRAAQIADEALAAYHAT